MCQRDRYVDIIELDWGCILLICLLVFVRMSVIIICGLISGKQLQTTFLSMMVLIPEDQIMLDSSNTFNELYNVAIILACTSLKKFMGTLYLFLDIL